MAERSNNNRIKASRSLRGQAGRMRGGRGSGQASTGAVRLWGHHAVEAALNNPERRHRKLWATRKGIEMLNGELPASFVVEYAQAADLARLIPGDSPHQGLVLDCQMLEDIHLDEVLQAEPERPLLVLDQVTDPHNVGAILRSAAAFNAAALITQDRHSPQESGTLAKSASGALEIVPWVRVVNLARALEDIANAGYWRIGLEGKSAIMLDQQALPQGPIALVLGGEGSGMRRNIALHCDTLVCLPISSAVESLNVSNAAAISLYALSIRQN